MPTGVYFDMTVTIRSGLNTGIQRVVRSLGRHFPNDKIVNVVSLDAKSQNYIVLSGEDIVNLEGINANSKKMKSFVGFVRGLRATEYFLSHFSIAVRLKQSFQNQFSHNQIKSLINERNEKIKIESQDTYVTFDAFWNTEADLQRIKDANSSGARIIIFVHDVLPITNPEWFEGQSVSTFKDRFMTGINLASQLLFSTEHVRTLTADLLSKEIPSGVVVLGSNLQSDLEKYDEACLDFPDCFLMLGTLEPRKNYQKIIQWHSANSANRDLVIVGRKGWLCKPILGEIKKCRRAGVKVHWLGQRSDSEILRLMERASLGICASVEEGYGLPLREFLAAKLPVVASNISVFREVAEEGVFYFDPISLDDLDTAVREGLQFDRKKIKASLPMWDEAAANIVELIS
jgi:glycosyltransferase involved in cell wall biosynthesis